MAAVMRIVAALLSGVMLAQAHSLEPIWLVAWFAPIPLLLAATGATWGGSLLLGAVAGAMSTAFVLSYFNDLVGPLILAAIVLAKALIWAAAAFCHRTTMRGLPAWAAVFAFPAFVAGVETLVAAFSPHGSAGAFAYSQIEYLPVVQVASLGGASAITFVVCLFATGLAAMIARRSWIPAVAPVAIVTGLLVWGALRPPPMPRPSPTDLRIALLSHDSFASDATNWRMAWDAYAAQAERVAEAGANVIVLPEKIATLSAGSVQQALKRLHDIAARHGVLIVAGATAVEQHFSYNRAWLVGGESVRTYNKRHLIPGLEAGIKRGVADLYVSVGQLRMGVAICKDMDFPALGRRYGSYGAALMLVPAWDFGQDAWLHSRMAMLRAVESGFWMARSTREGLMLVSDPYGRVVAQRRSAGEMGVLPALVPMPKTLGTIYVRIGDAFGWACLAASLALTLGSLALVFRRKKR